jgi:hypothetical protein
LLVEKSPATKEDVPTLTAVEPNDWQRTGSI